jgi:cell division protein FtsB
MERKRNMPKMPKALKLPKLPKIPFNMKKIGLAVLAIVLFFLVMDLNNRLNELSRLSAQQENAATVISDLQSTLNSLNTQVAFANSEGAVEEWAYSEGHMTRPGENLVIPLVPAGTTPIPETVVTTTPEAVKNWQVWLALISGK